MAKQINFNYEGKDYCLEFTRDSVKTMERQGFVASDIVTKPMTVLPQLFAGAFIAHHKFAKPEQIEKMFARLTNRAELVSKLSEMYNEPIMALMDDPEEDQGNVSWEGNW